MHEEDKDRAIAEALGWRMVVEDCPDLAWQHPNYPEAMEIPRLTDNNAADRAMCFDAVELLGGKDWYFVPGQIVHPRGAFEWVGRAPARERDDVYARTLPAALRAAMIRELGL